ncbi:MAG: site-2 protease family protein [Microthrixaceae bacterium]|nr:site-2 protease family protein [Microthrixaceae bacterium]
MRASLRIGRLFGVPLYIQWSVLVVAGLIAWFTSNSLVTRAGVDPSTATSLGLSFVAGYLASVLLHEIGHMVAAKHFGIGVRRISLLFYGGAAELESSPPDPVSEFWVALAGPLASAGCAVAAVTGHRIAIGAEAWLSADILGALAWANVAMVIINLLPGFPLDGGRVVLALIWWGSGDRRLAHRVVSFSGLGLGVSLLATGALFLWWDRPLVGLPAWWALIIGWFLVMASDVRSARVAPAGCVGDRMGPIAPAQAAWAPSGWFLANVVEPNPAYQYFPLADENGQLVGMVSEAQLRSAAASTPPATPVSKVGWSLADLAYSTPDESLGDTEPRRSAAASQLTMVLSGGRPVGVVGDPVSTEPVGI